MGAVELRIERHNEFTAFTVLAPQAGVPFAESAADQLPAGWLDSIPGRILAAVEIASEQVPTEDAGTYLVDDEETKLAFNAGLMVTPGRKVSGGFVYKQGRTYNFNGRVSTESRNLLVGGPFETASNDPVHPRFRARPP